MAGSENPVIISTDEAVGIIELARPDVFNAISTGLCRALRDSLLNFEVDPEIRAILIRSRGDNFCVGADLAEVKSIRSSSEQLDAFLREGHAALAAIEGSPLPVVMAVQGLALAGGLELLLAADIVFAARTARLGDQHGQFGLVPGWGGSQRLPRAIGMRRALDLTLGVRWISAETALEWGLVNYVTDDELLVEESLAYCRKLATRSRNGLTTMKRLVRDGRDRTLSEGLQMEIAAAVPALQSSDVSEGLSAFEQRRKPQFS